MLEIRRAEENKNIIKFLETKMIVNKCRKMNVQSARGKREAVAFTRLQIRKVLHSGISGKTAGTSYLMILCNIPLVITISHFSQSNSTYNQTEIFTF